LLFGFFDGPGNYAIGLFASASVSFVIELRLPSSECFSLN